MHTSLQHLAELKTKGRKILFPDSIKIMVGAASCGLAAGAETVFNALLAGVKKRGLQAVVTKTGCVGICHQEPIVDISMPGKGRFVYGQVTPDSVSSLLDALEKNVLPSGALFRLSREESLLDGSVKRYPSMHGKSKKQAVPILSAISFYKKQYRIALRNCGLIDPENIMEYVALGGYRTLADIIAKKTPQQVINEIKRAGLRGRGGAGFLTSLKWSICRNSGADQKYIICNADEGDPGAYMDRSILEGDPHSVLEGMLTAAYAIGANKGYIYVRDEYPLAIKRLEQALDEAQQLQLLGERILHSAFSCSITIIRGAGAFVCGEETALIKSIEGSCGEPNQRPPYPAVSGLWGKPTVINNVETLTTVPVIMAKGARWFSSIGTQKSKGTKVFSLVGKVNHIGLVEVPMGTTLREIIYDIGGGVTEGRICKAVQTGGPSGGCIPAKLFDLPVDYEALAKAGSIMGSGGLIVMDDRTCMVDVARYFMTFLEHESCGKCTPCRVGVRRMREMLDSICSGTAELQDLEVLEHLARMISRASLCGLGRTAPNPVLSGLQYFKDEFIAHIQDKKCSAGVCKPLVAYVINTQTCIGCGACIKACPAEAVKGSKKKPHSINSSKCIKCGACEEICPAGAVAVK